MPTIINPLNRCAIYSCQEWGAKPPVHSSPVVKPKNIIVHHMAWPNRALIPDHAHAVQDAFHVARSCQIGHFGNGWADTGQNLTISRDGIPVEGRHGSVAAIQAGHTIVGAHAADPEAGIYCNDTIGIECEGTYSTEHMPSQQWETLVDVCSWACHATGLRSDQIIGHCDTGIATECPGRWLHAQLGLLRQAVHARLAGMKS